MPSPAHTFCVMLIGLMFISAPSSFAAEDDDLDAAPSKPSKRKAKSKRQELTLKLDKVMVEGGAFLNDRAPDSFNTAHLATSLNWQPNKQWELQLAGRLDGYLQTGTPDFSRLRGDYGETFVRWRGEDTRFTLGTQNISWGRTDEIQPVDRLSRVDVNRFTLDKLRDRRRAVPALRLEKFFDNLKIDTVWVPDLQPAELPPFESVWHPIDRVRGRILGAEDSANTRFLVRNGTFAEDQHGAGGGGIRITNSGGGFDWGLSLQRVRQSLPYYQLNPGLRDPLLMGVDPATALASVSGPTYTAIHPMSTVLGAELEFQGGGATWRFESAYSTHAPATTDDLRFLTPGSYDLVAGVEFFPGDKDTRVTVQVAGHQLNTHESLLERKNSFLVTGDIEHPFAQGRWRANLRFVNGLNYRDNYVSPRITYLGFEGHELYLAAHLFSGTTQAIGGFHRDHDLITLGWQAKF